MIFPCVGLASNPLSRKAMQISQAVSLSSVSLITIAFNNPRPRTKIATFEVEMYSFSLLLKSFPNARAFLIRFYSFTTLRAAIATAAAIGFPPKVEPCWPGLITFIMELFAKTAETG